MSNPAHAEKLDKYIYIVMLLSKLFCFKYACIY